MATDGPEARRRQSELHPAVVATVVPVTGVIASGGRSHADRLKIALKVEKDRLVRLAATRHAQDSGDLFVWAKDGPQKIAHVLVQDGCAQSSLAKVKQVAQAMLMEAKRLDREAREAQRAAR